jgi:leucyl aminopeptidase (aminopeptidase T)
MRRWAKCARASIVLALGILATTTVAMAGGHTPDCDATAQRLVNECAAIQEGDVVWIHGNTNDIELLESVAVHVRKRGAFPLLSITTDDLTRRMYEEVPAKYDTQKPELGLKLAGMIDAVISVSAEENPALLADVPPERIAAHGKTSEQVYKVLQSRKVRQVNLGNNLYPTTALAKQFGISRDELATVFWNGVNIDYRKLQRAADTVQTYLASGNAVRITNKNGTDISMQIKRRPVHVNDGVISSDDIRSGGAACQVWLPAGEVYLAPIPGTATGTVVVDRHLFRGQEIRKLRMDFRDGKLTSMTAKSGLEPLRKFYDACGPGKEEFAAIDIGINPNVRIPPDSRMTGWMASGMITVGVGMNTWAGGENTSEFALFTHLPGSTLIVDGRTLVDEGVLKP